MYWVRRWEITIEWETRDDSPFNVKVLERRCDTPAELRKWVELARADRWVIRFPYKSVRELEGESASHCPRGHALEGNSANRSKLEWFQCGCGGHMVMICKVCGAPVVDPSPDSDCDVDLTSAP
jgi:hypothetical protein